MKLSVFLLVGARKDIQPVKLNSKTFVRKNKGATSLLWKNGR